MRGDEVDQAAVKVWNVGFIGSPDVAGVPHKATLPYIVDFLRDIYLKMGAPDEALGRRYQREIICRGTLEIISPLSGRRTTAAESFLVGGKNFFRFREPDDFFVAASRVTLGYPLLALFFPGGNLLVKWHVEKDKRGIQPKDVADLAAVVAGKEKRERREKREERVEEVAAVMGHKNFAHHLWNELPALERLIEDLPAERSPHLLLGREPLGPIDLIFPEVAHWRIERLNGASRSVANCSGRIFVNLGSYRITTGLRDRVTNYAQRMASETATHLIESVRGLDAPVFWLSVRMQTPTLANQRAVLSDVGVEILKKFPRCTILFDGFSPPHDWRESARNDVQFYRTATQLSKDEIDAIVDGIVARQTPSESQQMANLAGLGILDCIALAKLATSYFCHIGTVQHKIGWTANIPGMIHANRSAIIYRSPIWYAPERLENAVVPVAIDDNLVSHLNDRKYYEFSTIELSQKRCAHFLEAVSRQASLRPAS